MTDNLIERKIIIGLISSTEFIKRVREIYQPKLMASDPGKRLSKWCMDYFDDYKEAPNKNIEGIYLEKLKKGLPKNIAEEIEEDFLPNLNEEYIQADESIDYLVTQTEEHWAGVHLQNYNETLQALLDEGDVTAANTLAASFKPLKAKSGNNVLFSDEKALTTVKNAFEEAQEPLIRFPRQLGKFWNYAFVRGGFVALMGSEKRGKSFWLMELAEKAVKQGRSVAFFQAGDMTETQQTRRFCIHVAKKSDKEKYCGKMFQPVRDCVKNQLDICDKEERECDFGVFSKLTEKELRTGITLNQLEEAYKENDDYRPCYNCAEYDLNHWGTAWIEKIDVGKPLMVKEALEVFEDFFIKKKRNIMLSSHANSTLTVAQMKVLLDSWEKQDDFIPDVIIVDYADLLVCDSQTESRHQQNEVWKALRSLSQEKRGENSPLVITVTQADANSYDKNVLNLKNFSEDKRKYGHVTAMFGLNQDPQGREKKIGIMRINELVLRDDDFSVSNVVHVLQNLKRGLPFLGSYF